MNCYVRPLVAFFAFGAILVQIKWTQQGKKLRFLSIWTTHNIKEGKAVATFQERKGKGRKKSFRAIVRRKGHGLSAHSGHDTAQGRALPLPSYSDMQKELDELDAVRADIKKRGDKKQDERKELEKPPRATEVA